MKPKTILFLTAGLMLASAAPVMAQSADHLTDGTIRQYYAELPDLFKKPYEDFIKDYSARASDDLQITNKTIVNIVGQRPNESTENLTKDQLVAAAPQAYQAAQQAKLWNQVTSILISPDGKTAEVHEISRIKGMTMPSADAARPFQADSVETCLDHLIFTPGIGIQTTKSDCNVDVTVTQKL